MSGSSLLTADSDVHTMSAYSKVWGRPAKNWFDREELRKRSTQALSQD
jgi:hypothetical protein